MWRAVIAQAKPGSVMAYSGNSWEAVWWSEVTQGKWLETMLEEEWKVKITRAWWALVFILKIRCKAMEVFWANDRQTYLLLLHLADTAFFTNWRFGATQHHTNLSVPFFQQHLLTWYFCVTLVTLPILQTCSLLFLCYGDRWLVIFGVPITTPWKLRLLLLLFSR